MLIPFTTAIKERYGDYIQKWWMGGNFTSKLGSTS